MSTQFYKKGTYREGASISEIFDALETNKITLHKPCGGRGSCGKCRVAVTGEIPEPSAQEVRAISSADLSSGIRLACCVKPTGDFTVTLIPEEEMSILSGFAGAEKSFRFQKTGYGLAVDIGTTTIVAAVYDLSDGTRKSAISRRNEQGRMGADVISRMTAAAKGMRGELHRTLVAQLSGMIREACKEAGVAPHEAIVTGNTTMLHFLTDLDTHGMAVAPFTPTSLFGCAMHSSAIFQDFDFMVYLPRCIGSFVGADILCGIVASGMYKSDSVSVLVDLGTNGEAALACKGRIYCISTAAGPAFEGAQIHQGVPSVNGAIFKVFMDNGHVGYETIGGGKAVGICGSGIVDAVDVMLRAGAVNEMGTFNSKSGYVTDGRFAIGDSSVALTQGDIRQVQLAKSAIYSGIITLLHEFELSTADVNTFYIAGGFGNYLNLSSAAGIGLIPPEFVPIAVVMGNSALSGACALLTDDGLKKHSDRLAKSAYTLDLSGNAFFMDNYVENMIFHTGDSKWGKLSRY